MTDVLMELKGHNGQLELYRTKLLSNVRDFSQNYILGLLKETKQII
jgi:hypothetical protein